MPNLLQWPQFSILHVCPHGVHDSVDLLHAGLEWRPSFAAYVDGMWVLHPWQTLVPSVLSFSKSTGPGVSRVDSADDIFMRE